MANESRLANCAPIGVVGERRWRGAPQGAPQGLFSWWAGVSAPALAAVVRVAVAAAPAVADDEDVIASGTDDIGYPAEDAAVVGRDQHPDDLIEIVVPGR